MKTTVTKEHVEKALGALDESLDNVVKGEKDGELGDGQGAATKEGSLKTPGEDMNKKAGVTAGKAKTEKSVTPVAKSDDNDADDAEGDEDEVESKEQDKEKGKKPAFMSKKSMPADFFDDAPSEVTTKIDVSRFLRSLVDHTADSMDTLRDYVVKSDLANENRVEQVEQSLNQIQKSLGNVGIVLKAVCEKLGVIEAQPARIAKSAVAAASVTTAQVAPRDMTNHDAALQEGKDEGGMFKSLVGRPPHVAKAMVSDALCDLVRKGEAKDTDVINFETYGVVPPQLETKLRTVLG